MIQKIKPKSFVIKDFGVVDFMRSEKISHIKFNINIDDGVYVSIEFPDNKKMITLGKNWFKVHYGLRTVSSRTPLFLLEHKGMDVDVYKDKSSKNKFELLRIKPVGFEISNMESRSKKPVGSVLPYFSKSGYCFIPKRFLDNNFGDSQGKALSFNRTNDFIVQEGFIFCRVTEEYEIGNMSYPINNYGNGFRTRILLKLHDLVSNNGKELKNFQYKDVVMDDELNYKLIIFEEVSLNG
jgi:hypothetical protein